MHLGASPALVRVERSHPVDVIPDFPRPASRCHHHEGRRQLPVLVQPFRQCHMLLVAVYRIPAVFPINILQVVHGNMFQFFLTHQTVPGAAPEPVCIDLPLRSGIFRFALLHRLICVGIRPVRRQFPKQQDVFRASSNPTIRLIRAS